VRDIYLGSYADWREFGENLLFTREILETGGAGRDISELKTHLSIDSH